MYNHYVFLRLYNVISSKYLAIHDCQIVIKYNQIILILNNLIGKTYYITSCGNYLAFSLAKNNAGDLALFDRMIGDIYWEKTKNICQCCVCEVSVHNISDG